MQPNASSPTIVARFAKNRREHLVVSLSVYRDTPLVDLRLYVPAAEGEGERPTPKGIALNVALIPELRAALEAAEAEAIRLGMISFQAGTKPVGGSA
jgi:hypothetical protein